METAQVKFYKEKEGFGFTENDLFFHISGFRTNFKTWFGSNEFRPGKPDLMPFEGQQIVVLTRSEGKNGKDKITWTTVDEYQKTIDLFIVVSENTNSVEGQPVCDNAKRSYRVEINTTKTIAPAFIGDEDSCDKFIKEHPHRYGLSKRRLTSFANGVEILPVLPTVKL